MVRKGKPIKESNNCIIYISIITRYHRFNTDQYTFYVEHDVTNYLPSSTSIHHRSPAWQGDEYGFPPKSGGTWRPCPVRWKLTRRKVDVTGLCERKFMINHWYQEPCGSCPSACGLTQPSWSSSTNPLSNPFNQSMQQWKEYSDILYRRCW